MKADPSIQTQYALAVVDTNVLLSAFLSPSGTPAMLLDTLLKMSTLVFSAATFDELDKRLWLPKFDPYLSVELRRKLLLHVRAAAVWIDIPGELAKGKYFRDPNDDAFIHAATAAGALRLISGDKDLLCLHPLGALHILTPRQA